nr:DUF4129 domain-containing protein [Deltaproteobacteria bacterium]
MSVRRWSLGLLVAVLLGLCAGPAHAAKTAAQVLSDRSFGFCHDPRYPLTEEEAEWCEVLPPNSTECPAFASACKAPRAQLDGPPGPLSVRSQSDRSPEDGEDQERGETDKERGKTERGQGAAGQAPPKSRRTMERKSSEPGRSPESDSGTDLEAGSMGPLAHILLWVIVIAMVVFLVLQVRGPTMTRSPRPADEPGDDQPAAPSGGEGLLAGITETDVDRLLARARHNVERGQLTEAITDGHAALLRRLAEAGRIELHPSLTNGDHVRSLRGDPELHSATRDLVGVVERVHFGDAPPSAPQVEQWLARVKAVVGSLAGLVLMVWVSLACGAQSSAPREYPWSHSPSGSAGVLRLLRSHGLDVEYRAEPLSERGAHGPVPVILDRSRLTNAEWESLVARVKAGGQAVVATREDLPAALPVGWQRRGDAVLLPPLALSSADAPRLVVPGEEGL